MLHFRQALQSNFGNVETPETAKGVVISLRQARLHDCGYYDNYGRNSVYQPLNPKIPALEMLENN